MAVVKTCVVCHFTNAVSGEVTVARVVSPSVFFVLHTYLRVVGHIPTAAETESSQAEVARTVQLFAY